MNISVNQKELLIQKVKPQILKWVRHSSNYIKRFGFTIESAPDYARLADAAIYLALENNPNHTEDSLFQESKKHLQQWVVEDFRPFLAEWQRLYKNKVKTQEHDYYALPWGATVSRRLLDSGIDPQQMAIEPATADMETLQNDQASQLFNILDDVLAQWGPFVLCWLVASMDGNFNATLRSLNMPGGTQDYNSEMHKIVRILKKVKKNVERLSVSF